MGIFWRLLTCFLILTVFVTPLTYGHFDDRVSSSEVSSGFFPTEMVVGDDDVRLPASIKSVFLSIEPLENEEKIDVDASIHIVKGSNRASKIISFKKLHYKTGVWRRKKTLLISHAGDQELFRINLGDISKKKQNVSHLIAGVVSYTSHNLDTLEGINCRVYVEGENGAPIELIRYEVRDLIPVRGMILLKFTRLPQDKGWGVRALGTPVEDVEVDKDLNPKILETLG